MGLLNLLIVYYLARRYGNRGTALLPITATTMVSRKCNAYGR
jgi:hypothetical protein